MLDPVMRALVLRAPGINCDLETANACRLAGFAVDLVHINQLIREPQRLLDYAFLVIPGGFSYGDDLGAGTLLAKNLTIHLGPQLRQFIEEGRPVLGICNGFQVLVRAGLLPGIYEGDIFSSIAVASLTDNMSGQFECRWVTLGIEHSACIFTRGIDHAIELPVAHGEGQFVLVDPELLTQLQANGQVPVVYTSAQGSSVFYPANPNGSIGNVAGICNARGNVFGLMPHPERYVSALQHPQRHGNSDGTGDGLRIFKNAYDYAARYIEQWHIKETVGADLSWPTDNFSARNPSEGRTINRRWAEINQPPQGGEPTHRRRVDYAASGVDIDAADAAKELMKEAVQATHGPSVLAGMGAFAGVLDIGSVQNMRQPALVASTDGVGTKTLIAAQAGRFDTIGYDLVNHSVNDLLMQGARPLFFMDYLAMGKLDPVQAATIVRSVAKACQHVGCALLGGETAEMPDVYLPGAFDLAGTIVGVVERDALVNGADISEGDVILGLSSSGLHTNGYSLARRVFAPYALDTVFPELGEPLVDALLRPHRCYLSELQKLQQARIPIKGMAHITGGGFAGNISRILPKGMQAVIETGAWTVPPLFQLLTRLGEVSREEQYRTLNMGIGMIMVLSAEAAEQAQALLPELVPIGYIITGEGVILHE